LVKDISPWNKADGFFRNYNGMHAPGKIFRIWKFDVLRVPPIQIPTKKGLNMSSYKFHPRTKLTALLVTKMMPKNQEKYSKFYIPRGLETRKNTQNLEILHPKVTLHTNCD
jgi:hypothetical protein